MATRYAPGGHRPLTQSSRILLGRVDAGVGDTTPPTVTVSSAATQKISDETGKDSYTYAFQADEACQAYEIMIVPSSGSARAAGTLVESGGSISANTTINGSVTFTELQAAGQTGTEGDKILKFFARDTAGNWSS